jgi:hypothetical protein
MLDEPPATTLPKRQRQIGNDAADVTPQRLNSRSPHVDAATLQLPATVFHYLLPANTAGICTQAAPLQMFVSVRSDKIFQIFETKLQPRLLVNKAASQGGAGLQISTFEADSAILLTGKRREWKWTQNSDADAELEALSKLYSKSTSTNTNGDGLDANKVATIGSSHPPIDVEIGQDLR